MPPVLTGGMLETVKELYFFINNRAAGEREGVRPASQFNTPPLKQLDISSCLNKVF